MNKQPVLPIAVQNLRRIWNAKKIEMQFNQTNAAKELGWSQGAVSHYLNDITEMGPAAVVKFANFLNVDPTDIDPTIIVKLPKVRKVLLTKSAADMALNITHAVYDRDDIPHIFVRIDTSIPVEGGKPGDANYGLIIEPGAPAMLNGVMKLCKVSAYPSCVMVAVRLKTEKKLRVYLKNYVPEPSKIHTAWAIMSVSYF